MKIQDPLLKNHEEFRNANKRAFSRVQGPALGAPCRLHARKAGLQSGWWSKKPEGHMGCDRSTTGGLLTDRM